MRICLIIPPSPFLTRERAFMNLGILRVAAVLEQEGYKIDFLDLSGIENYLDVVTDYMDMSQDEIFGLTATTPQLPSAVLVCKTIHSYIPEAKVILGGPHVTAINASYKHKLESGMIGSRAMRAMHKLCYLFDVIVAGDGERAIFEAIKQDSPILIDADKLDSPLFLTEDQMNMLPFPARHLVDVDGYKYMIDGERALSIMSQQGCPYSCSFCGGRASPCMRKVRARSVKNTVNEMVYMHSRYNVNGFMLYDDELNLVNCRLLDLMHALTEVQRNLSCDFRLRGFVRSNLFTDEQAEAMHRAGFRWILVGFESGSPRMLHNMQKRATVEDNTRCIEIAKRHGLKVKAAMSIGHPGESIETIKLTRDWLLQACPDAVDVSIVTPYPGSPYYDQAVYHSDGIWEYTYDEDKLYIYDIDYTTTEHYYKGNPDGGYKSYVYTEHLSAEELVEFRGNLAEGIRRALEIPSFIEVVHTQYEGHLSPSVFNYTKGQFQFTFKEVSDAARH